ncbi:glycosyltransferase family 2 protein [Candidatus Woesearchaeota archaeon]|nr:glycosyltransferase family 2 protein [Candidatus Woesearchaeota archaeon]
MEHFERSPKRLKKLPEVSVAIPAYNEEDNIEKTISSVLNLDYPKHLLELVVVNDGSTDKTEHIINNIINSNKDRNIKLITQKNSGKGSALNKALEISKGEFFVVLDADSFANSDALKKMLPSFEDKDVAIVLPLMKIHNPRSFLQRVQWSEYLINFFYKSLMGALNCVHVAPGPFSVYRKKILKEAGGFDERNLTEDLEITLRIHKAHYKVVQLLNTEVYTNAPDTLKDFYKQRNRWYKGTMFNMFNYKWMVFNKRYGDFGMLQMPRVFISGFLAVSLLLLTLYRFVFKTAFDHIYRWSKINFDLLSVIRNLSFDFSWIEVNFTNLFFFVVSIILGAIVIFYAHRFTKEKMLRYGIFSLPAYLILYSILVSGVWLGVFIEMLLKRKQKW